RSAAFWIQSAFPRATVRQTRRLGIVWRNRRSGSGVSPAQAPAEAAEAVAAAPDTCQSPGSPSHPGTSASPEAAEAVVAEVEAEAEAVAAALRNYMPGSSAR